jgi:aryl-alcohol dehydrogenase-like predicted oxidoreductase
MRTRAIGGSGRDWWTGKKPGTTFIVIWEARPFARNWSGARGASQSRPSTFTRPIGKRVRPPSPLANGLLTGKIDAGRRYGEGDLRRSNSRFGGDSLTKLRRLLDRIRRIAEDRALTTDQVVIAWTIAPPGVTHALVGARTPEQAAANAKAGRISLSEAELKEIAAAIGAQEADDR